MPWPAGGPAAVQGQGASRRRNLGPAQRSRDLTHGVFSTVSSETRLVPRLLLPPCRRRFEAGRPLGRPRIPCVVRSRAQEGPRGLQSGFCAAPAPASLRMPSIPSET